MVLFSFLAPFVAFAGVLMYALSANPKVAEIGRLMFACGVLATLLIVGHSHPMVIP